MLGFILDHTLTWDKHISYVANKLSRVVFLLRNLKKHVPYQYVKAAYFAYFQSIARYGLGLWGNSCHVNKIFLIQKMAIRALTNSSPKTHCQPLIILI